MSARFDIDLAMRRQEEIYAAADAEIWRRAVYEPIHGGWPLACIGGRPFLEYVARDAGLSPGKYALEIGCGAGAACEFLAQISGAHVAGIERNEAQFARASMRTARNPLLTFERHEASVWRDGRRGMDAVFLLDTLSLVPDWDNLLAATRSALAPGRPLYIADQQAGPAVRQQTLERANRIDGFVALHPHAVLDTCLAKAGFTQINRQDANADAITTFSTIARTVQEMAGQTPNSEFAATLEMWKDLTAFYLEAFKSRELIYSWVRAA